MPSSYIPKQFFLANPCVCVHSNFRTMMIEYEENNAKRRKPSYDPYRTLTKLISSWWYIYIYRTSSTIRKTWIHDDPRCPSAPAHCQRILHLEARNDVGHFPEWGIFLSMWRRKIQKDTKGGCSIANSMAPCQIAMLWLKGSFRFLRFEPNRDRPVFQLPVNFWADKPTTVWSNKPLKRLGLFRVSRVVLQRISAPKLCGSYILRACHHVTMSWAPQNGHLDSYSSDDVDLGVFLQKLDKATWGFPGIGEPPNHPFSWEFPW